MKREMIRYEWQEGMGIFTTLFEENSKFKEVIRILEIEWQDFSKWQRIGKSKISKNILPGKW